MVFSGSCRGVDWATFLCIHICVFIVHIYLNNPLKTEQTLSHYILEESIFNFRYVRLYDVDILKEKMVDLFANSGDPDQMLHSEHLIWVCTVCQLPI